jgi:hypothetical protein
VSSDGLWRSFRTQLISLRTMDRQLEDAEALWELRAHPRLQEHYERMLARMVNWAGHGMLV